MSKIKKLIYKLFGHTYYKYGFFVENRRCKRCEEWEHKED